MDTDILDEQETETAEEYEPKITSEDPEERKLARRLRIQRRIEAIKRQHESEGLEVPVVVEKSLVNKQTELSADTLEKLLVEGEEVVTNVRVGNDTREANRRTKEAARRTEILEQLENESREAEEMYTTITRKWDIICNYKDPLDISDSISLQRDACDDLIKQKDEIIAMLREEINQAEIKYVTDQETQKDDIAALVKRIDDQVDLMRRSYRHELQIIEETVATERQILIDANNKKWESLHKQRNTDEESNMQKKIDMADEFLQVFYDTRVAHEEKYRETKIALETEIEELQKELEQLKAACLLNGEKLDYNYNILKKREDENLIIRSQQKRLINKLQDDINKIKRNMKDYKEKSEETINKLILEIKKIRNSIFQTENKADHICTVNDKKYQEVWALNEERAEELLNKIKTTDRIIHEQLLGLEWRAPVKNFIKKVNLPSYKEAVEELNSAKQQNSLKAMKQATIKLEDGKEIPHFLLKSILDKIAFRSGFLLEQTIHSILPDLTDNNKRLIRADNVFNAIGITKPEHLHLIAELFLPFARCPVCERAIVHEESTAKDVTNSVLIPATATTTAVKFFSKEDDEEETGIMKAVGESPSALADIVISELEDDDDAELVLEESTASTVSSETLSEISVTDDKSITAQKIQLFQCKSNHPIYVENAHVYKMLRLFVKVGEKQQQEMTLQKRMHQKRNSLSRLISQEDVKTYWNQYTTMFSTQEADLWNGLLFGLKKYHVILEDRQKIYQEVVQLRKENFELRHMLKYCNFEKKKKTPRKKGHSYSKSASTPNIR